MPNFENAADERIIGPERLPAELLDVKALAQLGSFSTRHARRLADAGKMPAPIRFGGLVRWRRRDIEQWIADGCPPVRHVKGGAR